MLKREMSQSVNQLHIRQHICCGSCSFYALVDHENVGSERNSDYHFLLFVQINDYANRPTTA